MREPTQAQITDVGNGLDRIVRTDREMRATEARQQWIKQYQQCEAYKQYKQNYRREHMKEQVQYNRNYRRRLRLRKNVEVGEHGERTPGEIPK